MKRAQRTKVSPAKTIKCLLENLIHLTQKKGCRASEATCVEISAFKLVGWLLQDPKE